MSYESFLNSYLKISVAYRKNANYTSKMPEAAPNENVYVSFPDANSYYVKSNISTLSKGEIFIN